MPALPVPYETVRRTVEIWHTCLDEGWSPAAGAGGPRTAQAEVAERLTGSVTSNARIAVNRNLDIAVALGMEVRCWHEVDSDFALAQLRRYRSYDPQFQEHEARLSRSGSARPGKPRRRSAPSSGPTPDRAPPTVNPAPKVDPQDLVDRIIPLLRSKPLTLEEIAERLQANPMTASVVLALAHKQGAAVVERGGKWHLDAAPAMGIHRDEKPELLTDADGWLHLAACSDQHICSKYARLDCLEDYYDQVAQRGVKVVLNAGNWIDGEASFNMHDLLTHGMDAQMQMLARDYPKRAGVQTWAITGADHEGWYARREGVDVGRYAANVMQAAGRDDWRDMGYMEAYIRLTHAGSGQGTMLHLMHPGGGSAYAVSYAVQKIVEGYDGGDKPAVLLAGHYHKSGYNLIRNVHSMQTGCFQDQTVFMRQRKLSAHVGGCFVDVHVDPRTGAVDECRYTFRNYFVRDYYNGRWSQHGAVNWAQRMA